MQSRNGDSALVTGGHGFLGSHVVDRLLERGVRVRCLVRPDRRDDPFRGRPVEVVRGDLRTGEGLEAAAGSAGAVYHVAGLIAARGPSDFFRVNVEGTRRLARAVARSNPRCRRFLLVSSQAAAGPSPDGRPLDEEAPCRPVSHYGRSKLGAEKALREAIGGVPWTVLRPPAIYGPRDRGILPFFRLAATGFWPDLDGPGRRFNLLHARDVADAVLAAADSDAAAGRTYFLSDGRGYAHREVGEALGRAFGRRVRRVPVPDFLLDLAAVVTDEAASLLGGVPIFGRQKANELKARYWLANPSRAERDFGWRPRVPLETGLAETARWYEAAGWIRGRGRAVPAETSRI